MKNEPNEFFFQFSIKLKKNQFTHPILKSDSHLPKKYVLFASMKTH